LAETVGRKFSRAVFEYDFDDFFFREPDVRASSAVRVDSGSSPMMRTTTCWPMATPASAVISDLLRSRRCVAQRHPHACGDQVLD